MAKISTYPVDGLISTDDLLIGTDAENVNVTKNFTIGGVMSIANLQWVLDNGNTATENIVLTGNVSATNLAASTAVTAPSATITTVGATTLNATTVNATNANVTGSLTANDVEVSGLFYDSTASEGTNGQILKSTGTGVEWMSLPAPVIPGWNRYDDQQYTSISKLVVMDGVTDTLPNDGNKFSDMYGTESFYSPDTSTILAINENDTYIITVTFKASASNTSNGHLDISMSGPAGYNRIAQTITFPKGNNIEHNIHLVYQYYADADFVTNGAHFEVRPDGTDVSIWDIIYFIQRVQVA